MADVIYPLAFSISHSVPGNPFNPDDDPPARLPLVIPDPPVVDSLQPHTAEVGGPDIVLLVWGSGFTCDSVIVWNGADEPTTHISGNQLSTGVKPSTASGPWAIPVAVRNGRRTSNTVTFQFTEPTPPPLPPPEPPPLPSADKPTAVVKKKSRSRRKASSGPKIKAKKKKQ